MKARFWSWLHDYAWRHGWIGLHFEAWTQVSGGPCPHERHCPTEADGTPKDPTYYLLWAWCLYHTHGPYSSIGRWGLIAFNPWRHTTASAQPEEMSEPTKEQIANLRKLAKKRKIWDGWTKDLDALLDAFEERGREIERMRTTIVKMLVSAQEEKK